MEIVFLLFAFAVLARICYLRVAKGTPDTDDPEAEASTAEHNSVQRRNTTGQHKQSVRSNPFTECSGTGVGRLHAHDGPRAPLYDANH